MIENCRMHDQSMPSHVIADQPELSRIVTTCVWNYADYLPIMSIYFSALNDGEETNYVLLVYCRYVQKLK